MTKEFMTRHEREKMARHKAVCDRWSELRSNPDYADIAPSRIYGKGWRRNGAYAAGRGADTLPIRALRNKGHASKARKGRTTRQTRGT